MSFKRESKEKNEIKIRQIKEILNEPSSLIPDCIDKGFLCPFSSYEKKLSGNVDLDKFSKSHDEFLRGLSETKRAVEDENVSFSGLAKTPHGTATFFRKGDTDQFVLAGIQNSKNDIFRMLAFSRLVSSGKVIVYSAADYYRATCKGSPPDRLFVEKVLKNENISYNVDNDGIITIGSGEDSFTLNIMGIPSIKIGSLAKTSVPVHLIKYILSKNPVGLLSFQIPRLEQFSDRTESELFSNYVLGKLSDGEFFNKIVAKRLATARQSGLFIIGKQPYNNLASFLGEIEIPDQQKNIISDIWPSGQGIYIDDKSQRKFYETIWSTVGEEFLKRLYPDSENLPKDKLRGNPMEILEKLEKQRKLAIVSKSLGLKPWSVPSTQLAELIVIGISEGKEQLDEYISKMEMKLSDSQAVAHCIQTVFDLNRHQSWKISDDAILKGNILIPSVKEIVSGKLEKPDSKFQELSKIIR